MNVLAPNGLVVNFLLDLPQWQPRKLNENRKCEAAISGERCVRDAYH